MQAWTEGEIQKMSSLEDQINCFFQNIIYAFKYILADYKRMLTKIIPVVLPSVCEVCPSVALYRCLLIKSPKYFSIWKVLISFQHCAIHSSWFGSAAAAEAFHSWIPWVRVPTSFFPGSQTSDTLNFLHRLRNTSKTKPLFLWSISVWEFPVKFSKIQWLNQGLPRSISEQTASAWTAEEQSVLMRERENILMESGESTKWGCSFLHGSFVVGFCRWRIWLLV